MLAHDLTHTSLLDILDGLEKEMGKRTYRKNALAAGRRYLERYIDRYKLLFESENDIEDLTLNGINKIIRRLKDELNAIKREIGSL